MPTLAFLDFSGGMPIGIAILAILLVAFFSGWIRYIQNNKVGIVEKVISRNGSIKKGFIALNGEAGYQPDILRGGWHVLMPFVFRVHRLPLVSIP